MRSHFHGSLRRHPTQTPTTAYQQYSSSLTTLPATTSYHPQSSLSSPDGHLSLQPQPSLANATKAAPSPFQSARPAPVPDVICCLCDKIADTILIPCNHVVLCAEHAKLSKKCPECRDVFTSTAQVIQRCAMCQDDPVSVTMKPCGHRFCVACGKRMKMCFTCKTEIKTKEGLSEEDADESLCKICIERKLQVVFDACGHMSCSLCAQKMKECPFCRTPLSRIITIYN